MVSKKIWMYWEDKPGSSRPAYIDLSLETIKRHAGNYELIVLNEKTVKEYIKIPSIVRRFSEIAHRADYIRFNLLYQYGGVWLDSDLILMRNIEDAIEPFVEKYDFVGYGREYGKPSIGFMGSQKGCQLLGLHLKEINKVLRRRQWSYLPFRKVTLGWNELGYDYLWDIASRCDYYHHERSMFAPTVWSDWEVFSRTDMNVDEYLHHSPYAVMLYNKMMFEGFKDLSREQIIQGDTLLSKLFRKSLNVA
jgi:mannosyltransferase OCH1-like enzyme